MYDTTKEWICYQPDTTTFDKKCADGKIGIQIVNIDDFKLAASLPNNPVGHNYHLFAEQFGFCKVVEDTVYDDADFANIYTVGTVCATKYRYLKPAGAPAD